jgi:hypothetical protein
MKVQWIQNIQLLGFIYNLNILYSCFWRLDYKSGYKTQQNTHNMTPKLCILQLLD